MSAVYSGFFQLMVYANSSIGPVQDVSILTENSFDILTEGSDDIITETS